jgi:hypothetical protein
MTKPTENPGKGNGPNKGLTELTVNLVGDVNSDGIINHGDTITFTVVSDENWHQVNLTVTQNGMMVCSGSWPMSGPMTLSSRAWTEGAADAHAECIEFVASGTNVLAAIDFPVAA